MDNSKQSVGRGPRHRTAPLASNSVKMVGNGVRVCSSVHVRPSAASVMMSVVSGYEGNDWMGTRLCHQGSVISRAD